jgi:Uma2 family endonuclease
MLLETKKTYISREEYLLLEETATEKHEYIDGEIITMVGGTINHNQICLNFCRNFPLTIHDQDYYLYMEGVKLWLAEYNIYTYPDVMITEGKPIYQGDSKSVITNPKIIIEVLSKSTQDYDRTDKFRYYRSLPTLQEYILIDQYKYGIDQYFKQSESQWSINFYTQENSSLKLVSLPWKISLKELYQRIDFAMVEE